MKRFLVPGVFFPAILLLAGCQSPEPQNVTKAQWAATTYHNDGRYEAQFLAVTDQAQQYLSRRAAQAKPGQKLAVVFDLDETLLSNWPYLSEYQYSRTPSLVKAWMKQSRCPVLPSSMGLYREAIGLKMQVFFITGRATTLRAATLKNLQNIGVTQFAALYCRPVTDTNPSVIPYKTSSRKAITDQGYDIVMNIGDQWSDLKGGYAERTFKLPDPFYYIR